MFSKYIWDDCLGWLFFWDGLKPAIWFCFAVNSTEGILDWNIYTWIWHDIQDYCSQFPQDCSSYHIFFGWVVICFLGWRSVSLLLATSPSFLVQLQCAWFGPGANPFWMLTFRIWLPMYTRSSKGYSARKDLAFLVMFPWFSQFIVIKKHCKTHNVYFGPWSQSLGTDGLCFCGAPLLRHCVRSRSKTIRGLWRHIGGILGSFFGHKSWVNFC